MSIAASEASATTRGTPCAASWDEGWVAQVEAREQAMDRRICGARTIGGTPCPLPSDHASGRCRHHGGFPLTGAPEDNRNAVVHGLYSRRLMICGTHCPAWQSCPMGGGSTFPLESETGTRSMGGSPMRQDGDESTRGSAPAGLFVVRRADGTVHTHGRAAHATERIEHPRRDQAPLSYGQYLLTLPMCERPLCPYEQAEYNAVVTDVMRRANARAENTLGLHLAHQVALVTVMVSRSARALALKPLTEKMEQTAENYYMSVDKPSAALQAFERLSRELRRWIHLVEREYQVLSVDPATEREHELRCQCDTNPHPDEGAALDLCGVLAGKDAACAAAGRDAALDEIGRRIMDQIFSRVEGRPKDSTTKDTKSTKEDPGGSFPRTLEAPDAPDGPTEPEVPASAGMTTGAVRGGDETSVPETEGG